MNQAGCSLTIRPYNPSVDFESIIWVYQQAMITEPWFEDLSRDVVIERISADFLRFNSRQYVGMTGGDICAAMWWDQTDFDHLLDERGYELAKFWQEFTHGDKTVWFRDLLIAKSWQGKGMGGQMVNFAIEEWRHELYKFALLRIHLGGFDGSCMPCNIKALKLYERKGFNLKDIQSVSYDTNKNRIRMGYMVATL